MIPAMSQRGLVLTSLLLAAVTGETARAQALDPQHFHPAPTRTGLMAVKGGASEGPWVRTLTLTSVYVRDPLVLVDKDGDRIVQFEMSGGDLPQYGWGEWKEFLFWDDVKVGNTSHRLPVSGEYTLAYSNGDAWQVKVEYTNHRVFGTSINLSFQGEADSERK